MNVYLRKVAIPIYRLYARTRCFSRSPRVFLNSLPKAGTHLAMKLLQELPEMLFSGLHMVRKDFDLNREPLINISKAKRILSTVNQGQFLTAHIPSRPEIAKLLYELKFKIVFIIRDPRDVVVSHAFYVTRLDRHYLHKRYNNVFHSKEERIMASIAGFAADGWGPGLDPINSQLEDYAGWLVDEHTHACRFEDLIGPNGGGDPLVQRMAIDKFAKYVDRPISEEEINRISNCIWTPKSNTFRKGVIGDWKNHFNDEHKIMFKKIAGQHLISMGYETDFNW